MNKPPPRKIIREPYSPIRNVTVLKSFDAFLIKYGLYFLLSLIAIISFLVFKDFILLEKTYLFKDIGSDSINFFYPAYYNWADYFNTEGIPLWSFNQGMGQNIFPYQHMDPFSLFIIFMGKKYVYFTIFYAELIKVFCAGILFYLFLKKIIASEYTAILGGLLYSFSGFIILGGQWNIFSTQAVYVALLLYSFEKLYQDNNLVWFPVSIFLIVSREPLDLYFIGLFLLIYIIMRLFEDNAKKPKEILLLFTKLICMGITGIAMSLFFLVNNLQVVIDSPRVSGDASYFNLLFSKPIYGLEGHDFGGTHYLTSFMRFFSCDILGTGSNYNGWYNYLEAPLFYCGLISLLSFPHFLSLSEKRKLFIYFTLFAIFIIPVIFPFFRYAYWLFTGNYYRMFSFFVAVVIMLISMKSIDNIINKSKTNIVIIATTLFLFLFFLYYPYKNTHIIDKNTREIVAVFLIFYSALIYLIRFKYIKNIVQLLLLFLIAVELVYFSNITVNKRPVVSALETTQRIGYNDYTVDAVKYLKSEDYSFFRIHKDYASGLAEHPSFNDAKAQEFYGTPSYHSFNKLSYVKFLQELEIIEKGKEYQARWLLGLINYPWLHGFASIKYALSKNHDPYLLHLGYEKITEEFGDVKVFKNKFVLPLGFAYKKYIPLIDFKKLSQEHKMRALYKAVVIDDNSYSNFGNLTKLNLSEMENNYSVTQYAADINFLKKIALEESKYANNKITGKIEADQDIILFFSIPFDKGWNIKVNGKSVNKIMVNIGFLGVPVAKGLHDIELSFLPLYFYKSAAISIISFVLFICLLVFHNRKGMYNAKKYLL